MAPDSALCQEMARYLAPGGQDASLYADGKAFAAFIRGGGNRLLYARLSEALGQRYRQHETLRLLDIGVGDGLALPDAVDDRLAHVDLVEPSAPMLAKVATALARRGVPHTAHQTTLEAFARSPHAARARWDVVQATFSLHCIEPGRRAACLAWLRRRCDELLIAEFDVLRFDEPRGPARAAFLLERYERGVVEYTADRTLVAQGFLVPILIGTFTGDANQTFEQPMAAWAQACRDAGFADVHTRPLCRYWWSDAHLLIARRGASRAM
jgi:SAM-dependent methyltransferase